mmetsp:Transcript_631/g.702  ORF Transcript_631/g.702 Transcript_631/m.702 type:complete len:116 (-) Transcript_631:1978-2325(-)
MLCFAKCGGSSGIKNKRPVTIKYIQPQKFKYRPNENRPSFIGTVLRYLLAKSGELKARNIVNEEKYPVFIPTVWAVEAYDKHSGDKHVNAHPSTAISWVAQKNTNKKKHRVIVFK